MTWPIAGERIGSAADFRRSDNMMAGWRSRTQPTDSGRGPHTGRSARDYPGNDSAVSTGHGPFARPTLYPATVHEWHRRVQGQIWPRSDAVLNGPARNRRPLMTCALRRYSAVWKLRAEKGQIMKELALALAFTLAAGTALADVEVGITKEMPSATVQTANGPVEIARIQDTDNRIEGEWAVTSRPCPNFCIQPITPADGVTTIGELELIEMLQDPGAVVADSRTRDWFEGGTIPGAVSIPYTYILDELG